MFLLCLELNHLVRSEVLYCFKEIRRNILFSLFFVLALFVGIFIIAIGVGYLNTYNNNQLISPDSLFNVWFNGIVAIVLGASFLLIVIYYIPLKISLISFVGSILFLLFVIINWSSFETLFSSFTYSYLNLNVILYSFLLFWIIKIPKDSLWSYRF